MFSIKVTITTPTKREALIVAERMKNSLNADFGEYSIHMERIKQLIPEK